MLLIHGLGDGGFAWAPFLRPFGADIAAWTLDLRGHGDSDWNAQQSYGIEEHLQDAATVLEKLDASELIVIGHSLGAELAMRLAARYTKRVRALVVVDAWSGARAESADQLIEELRTRPRRYELVSDFANRLAQRLPLADPTVLNEYAAAALKSGSRGGFELKHDSAAYMRLQRLGEEVLRASIAAVRCPTLLVRGALSAIFSYATATRMASQFPTCKLATVPRAGHAILLENPAGLSTAVMPFVSTLR